MKKEVLSDWKYESVPLTPEKILEWAREAWNNDDQLRRVPKFIETKKLQKSDIRVLFTGIIM